MSNQDSKYLHKPSKEQEELLAKAQWGKSERVTLTKHCLFEYTTIHKFGTIDKRSYRVHWTPVGSGSQDASDRERIARFISELPSNDFWQADLKTFDQIMEWFDWRDRAIDIAKCFLAGRDNPDNPLRKELKTGLIDEETYKDIRLDAELFENWWKLVQPNEQAIKAELEKVKSWGYPFNSSRELVEEMIREDLEGEFANCLKPYYAYNSRIMRLIAQLKHKHCTGELGGAESQDLFKLIDQNVPLPIWYDRVISVSQILVEQGNTCIKEHLVINGKIINRLARRQYQRERSQSTSQTWHKGRVIKGILPKWKT